jgi:hypothetical protein
MRTELEATATSEASNALASAQQKIFVLGDSRTGTLTLHRYFEALGIASVHWYMKQSEQLKPPHEHLEQNWLRCRTFINSGIYRAFSDYPTRTYYLNLLKEYPDALFILSFRRDLETWKKSMLGFFSKFDIPLEIDKLSKHHIRVNDDIRHVMRSAKANFLEICIDDGSEKNSQAIKDFLGLESPIQMGWENQTARYENAIISRRAQFFSPTTDDVISYVEAMCRNTKAMPSEKGWLFLINDANDFLRYQFGLKRLSDIDLECAVSVVKGRMEQLATQGIAFINVIVPEKSVVYREYLPVAFETLTEAACRPAERLAEAIPETVHYLSDYLKDLRGYGLLYFRGDTHANWLGSYFVYRYIAEQMNRMMLAIGRVAKSSILQPLPLARLMMTVADYDGDLGVQLLDKHIQEYKSVWKFLQPAQGFERLLRYHLPDTALSTSPVEVPVEYQLLGKERPILVREHKHRSLPKAVIFRDSTADFLIELLAEHFSRSVFIWHKGLVYEDVIAREQPDVVIHLSAERFVWIYSRQPPFSNIHQEP